MVNRNTANISYHCVQSVCWHVFWHELMKFCVCRAPCSPQPSPVRWRVWPCGSGRFWWPRPRWGSTRKTPRCSWTSSTAWRGPMPAPRSCAGPGWTAWPERTWRMETCPRYLKRKRRRRVHSGLSLQTRLLHFYFLFTPCEGYVLQPVIVVMCHKILLIFSLSLSRSNNLSNERERVLYLRGWDFQIHALRKYLHSTQDPPSAVL